MKENKKRESDSIISAAHPILNVVGERKKTSWVAEKGKEHVKAAERGTSKAE